MACWQGTDTILMWAGLHYSEWTVFSRWRHWRKCNPNYEATKRERVAMAKYNMLQMINYLQ